MKKPTWEDAPNWARYLAMDNSNFWYWYSEKPSCDYYEHICCWKNVDRSRAESAIVDDHHFRIVHDVHWESTLEKRPG